MLMHEPTISMLDEFVKKPEDMPTWHNCPNCGHKLCRVYTDSVAHKIFLWCKHCKKEVELNI